MPLKIIDYKQDSIMLTSQMLLLGCHQSGTIKHASIKVNTFTTINMYRSYLPDIEYSNTSTLTVCDITERFKIWSLIYGLVTTHL